MDYNNINQLIKNKENEVNKLLLEINELKSKLNSKEIIQESLSDEEKINIFMDYFKGRDEVYPYLSIDKYNPNKKYYIPSCINEWKSGICNKTMKKPCRNCQYREDKPITKEVIYNHLYKNNPIGIYPMLDDDTCYFITFDFDDKENNNNIKDDVLAFSSVCDKYNVPIALEKSRSGNGIHIWIFFENKIKASIARKLGSLLLSKTMELRDNMNITTFDRMFPSQDFLPKGGYGNLIALPFQCEPSKYGNTLFYDRNFIRINNQFGYLKQLKKININEIFDIIKIISNETIDISNECINIKEEVKNKNKNLFDYPKYINVVLDNMVNIDKANLSGAVKNSFRRIASFANPEFYKNQRLRMSVYNIPMIISCSKETDKYLRLPRGTFEYLTDLCNEQNIQVNIIDKRNSGTNINVIFDGALREEQEKALEKLKEYENGILYAPTGFGKTVVSCKMIADKGINTLVITNKLQLLRQWQESIKKFLNINAGIICGGKNTITNIVDVASIKSIWNEGKFNDFVKNYGMIIIDECHHLAAFTYESAVNTVCAKYVYGVTATPERENGHTPIIKMQCGDIRYEVDFKKFNKELNIPMKVYKINNHLNKENLMIL